MVYKGTILLSNSLNLIYWIIMFVAHLYFSIFTFYFEYLKWQILFSKFYMTFEVFKRWMVLLPHIITLLFNVAFIRAILNKHMWKIKVTYISIFINLRYIHKFKMFLSASMCWFWHSSPSHIDSNSLFHF